MRYDYIAIEGNIGAGKTSLATRLAEDFSGKLVLEEFADNPFLPKFYEDRDRYAFPLELSFLAERFSQLKDILASRDLFNNFIVADYFISKSMIFSKANLKGDEFELFSKMFHIIEASLPAPSLIVFLHLNSDKLIENIQKRGRDYEQKIAPSYLIEVEKSYFKFIKQHRKLRVVVIDTNDVDFVSNEEDYQKIVSIIRQDHPKGITLIKA
ncbi:MAG: deoxyguanosine kinase [Flavobacteriales bacterium]|jgi:deoxyguanosine kinase